MAAAGRLPDRAALDELLAVAPLRWILVNRRLVSPSEWPSWSATFAAAGLRTAADFGTATLFEVPPALRTAPR